jgi:hypothetical protein
MMFLLPVPVGLGMIWLSIRKLRGQAPFWPWWLILMPLWLTVLVAVGFVVAVMLVAGFMAWLDGPMLL